MLKKIQALIAALTTILLSCNAIGGHHESLKPPAKPGQVIVTYRGECPSDARENAIAKIKEIILYERENSPVRYVSSPGFWVDGKVGAVDVHESEEAMNKAFEWQSADSVWSESYDSIAISCGVKVEDFEVSILKAQ